MAKLDDGEYMAFGLSGDPRRTKMIGGKYMLNCHVISGSGSGGPGDTLDILSYSLPPALNVAFKSSQVLKYQSSVISRLIFHHLIPLMIFEYQNISLDVTYG